MLNIIAAVSDNGVIGNDGKLPWSLRDDLEWFKGQTLNYPVVMGSKTFEEIISRLHKPLPKRENIVLTRSPENYLSYGVTVLSNFREIIERAKVENIFVIGGAKIYKQALPFAGKMFLTRVHAQVSGNTFFPAWNENDWNLVWQSRRNFKDRRNDRDFTWEIYDRRSL